MIMVREVFCYSIMVNDVVVDSVMVMVMICSIVSRFCPSQSLFVVEFGSVGSER